MKHKPGDSADGNSFSEFGAEGSSCDASYISLPGNVSLRKITFIPPLSGNLPEILFLPGLASMIENFAPLIKALTGTFKVHFLETREKKSSILPEGSAFNIHDMAGDIAAASDVLFEGKKYIIIGYSLGATTAAEAIPLMNNKPRLLILSEPAATFNFPKFVLFFARNFVPLYGLLKPVLKWSMRRGHINMKEDYEMYVINCRVIDNADPKKLASVVLAIAGYNIENALPRIAVPTVIIGTSKDKFHSCEEALKIASALNDCTYVDMENNKRTHSAEVAEWLITYLDVT